MNSIDLSPLYRSSIGFDRLASVFDRALSAEVANGYPPYNIEILDENRYAIALAVAGFTIHELTISVENGILTVKGEKEKSGTRNYLHQGIANRTFERKFNLADYVEVTEAKLENGLLSINLVREVPEAMKPKTIAIRNDSNALEHNVRPENVSSKDETKAA